jgi:hypothetical protein
MCSNIIHLKICTQVSQLQKLQLSTKDVEGFELLAENIYFPLKYASKLIQRFPSLIDIQLQVLSFDTCVHLVDILLDGLVNLLHLKIYFIYPFLKIFIYRHSLESNSIITYLILFPNIDTQGKWIISEENGKYLLDALQINTIYTQLIFNIDTPNIKLLQ